MNQLDILFVFSGILSLLYLRFIAVEYRNLSMSETRQKLFALRDELFDCAVRGEISFDDPSYLIARKTLNGFLRYIHDLSFTRIITLYLLDKLSGSVDDDEIDIQNRAILAKALSDENQITSKVMSKAHLLIAQHILSISPVTLLLIPLIPMLALLLLIIFVLKAHSKTSEFLNSKASEYGLWKQLDKDALKFSNITC